MIGINLIVARYISLSVLIIDNLCPDLFVWEYSGLAFYSLKWQNKFVFRSVSNGYIAETQH